MENIEYFKTIKYCDPQTFQPKIRIQFDLGVEQLTDDKSCFSEDEVFAKLGKEIFDKMKIELDSFNSKMISLSLIPSNLEMILDYGDVIKFDSKYLTMKQVFKPYSDSSNPNKFECKTFKTKISITEEIFNKIKNGDQEIIIQLLNDIQKEFVANNATHFYYAMISPIVNPDTMNIDYTILVRGIISNEKELTNERC